jgi:hypothetical protein
VVDCPIGRGPFRSRVTEKERAGVRGPSPFDRFNLPGCRPDRSEDMQSACGAQAILAGPHEVVRGER